MEKQIEKTFKNIDRSLFIDENAQKFCFILQDILKKNMSRNSMELKFFIRKIGFIYYEEVEQNCNCDEEKVEIELDQIFWPQFLIVKRKCIFETIDDTLQSLAKHPEVKRILTFIDHNDEENSIRKFLQQFKDYMIGFLNNKIVLEFKLKRQLALSSAYRRKAYLSYFECHGCGTLCSESPMRSLNFGGYFGLNMLMAGMLAPCNSDDEIEEEEWSSEEENEDREEDCSGEENEDQKDASEEEFKDQEDSSKEEDKVLEDSSKEEKKEQKDLSKEQMKDKEGSSKEEKKEQEDSSKKKNKYQEDLSKDQEDSSKEENEDQADLSKEQIKDQEDSSKEENKEQEDSSEEENKEQEDSSEEGNQDKDQAD